MSALPAEDCRPPIEVRTSALHGLGVFAMRRISPGTRILEYLGERVSHAEADRRYQHKDAADNHTFLFIVDARTVIDACVGGNERRRVFIDALRTIEAGEELTYDYQIQREADDPPDIDQVFACRCGRPGCRGTLLWPASVRGRDGHRRS